MIFSFTSVARIDSVRVDHEEIWLLSLHTTAKFMRYTPPTPSPGKSVPLAFGKPFSSLEIFLSKSFQRGENWYDFENLQVQSGKEEASIKCPVLQLPWAFFMLWMRVRRTPTHMACGLAMEDTWGSFNYCSIFNTTLNNCHEWMHKTMNVSFKQHYISEIIIGRI